MSLLKLQVIAHLGKDASVNSVNGHNVINFSCAYSEKYKDQHGTEINKVVWVECSLWRDSTEIVKYLTKGQLVYCEGIPSVNSYTTNDGKTGVSLRLNVFNIQLLGSANKPTNQPSNENSNTGVQNTQPANGDLNNPAIDDLPF